MTTELFIKLTILCVLPVAIGFSIGRVLESKDRQEAVSWISVTMIAIIVGLAGYLHIYTGKFQ